MTTITIDTPHKLTKTHFSSLAEVAYYFSGLTFKAQKKVSLPKKSHYETAMEDLEIGRNTVSLDAYIKKRGLIQ